MTTSKLVATACAGVLGAGAAYLIYRRWLAPASPASLVVSESEQEILAATDDTARVALLKTLFLRLYGAAPAKVAMAGGRVNLIGEHVDYPDVQFAGKPVVHLYSMGGAVQLHERYMHSDFHNSASKHRLSRCILVAHVAPDNIRERRGHRAGSFRVYPSPWVHRLDQQWDRASITKGILAYLVFFTDYGVLQTARRLEQLGLKVVPRRTRRGGGEGCDHLIDARLPLLVERHVSWRTRVQQQQQHGSRRRARAA